MRTLIVTAAAAVTATCHIIATRTAALLAARYRPATSTTATTTTARLAATLARDMDSSQVAADLEARRSAVSMTTTSNSIL